MTTLSAFSIASADTTSCGRTRVVVRPTATLPVSSAAMSRAEYTAGMAAVPGSDMPSASATHAIVLAVPITAHVPALTASWPSTALSSSEPIVPARNLAQ